MIWHGVMIAWAQFYVPLSIMHTVTNTGALFILLIDFMLEGKKISKKELMRIILTFLGVILISFSRVLVSWFMPTEEFSSNFENYRSDNPLVVVFWSMLLTLSMAVWAYGIYLTKKISVKPIEINYHFGILIFIVNSTIYTTLETKAEASVFWGGLIWVGIVLMLA